jgi:hypothetical protein
LSRVVIEALSFAGHPSGLDPGANEPSAPKAGCWAGLEGLEVWAAERYPEVDVEGDGELLAVEGADSDVGVV